VIGWWQRSVRAEGGIPAAIRETVWVIAGGVGFVMVTTFLLAFNSLMPGQGATALGAGSIAPQDFRAPITLTYDSDVLTERARQAAANAVSSVYDPPDPNVARQQLQLVRRILDYIEDVRRDPFGTAAQKADDLHAITALTLDDTIVSTILELDDATWSALDGEIALVLERVMRESIRDSDLRAITDQLPTQVSVRFTTTAAAVVVAVVEDLLRPNRLPNPAATEAARNAAIAETAPERRSFERGQIVVRAGARLDAADIEALRQLGLLDAPDQRAQLIVQATFTSVIVLIAAALYLRQRQRHVLQNIRFISLLSALFVLTLGGARLFGGDGQIYLYPAAALAVLLAALTVTELAIFGAVALGLLIGVMLGNSLEAAALVAFGGSMGALSLRRAERLNSYFFAGVVIALANGLVVIAFNFGLINTENSVRLGELILFGVINGVFSALTALAGLYLFTILFNLPTSLKLVELSQPNQPLLQRLLREAPGTYQHSLQVANLSEQAASAIGANADLCRVAALYHDVGKMLNPAFFVENQVDGVNPHLDLNDAYRSADIIIGHVTDGEKLAAQNRIPARIRDFIMEHHGTTLVSYFYNQALGAADDKEAVDIDLFTYPGPKPQSRETALLMLADSCESTVRARKPANKGEIAEIVSQIIDARIRDGQLNESGLRLDDLQTIRTVFVDMLQGVFHPRINYPTGAFTLQRPAAPATPALIPVNVRDSDEEIAHDLATANYVEAERVAPPRPMSLTQTSEMPAVRPRDGLEAAGLLPLDKMLPKAPAANPSAPLPNDTETNSDDDDRPLRDVPPLRRTQRIDRIDVKRNEGNG
jgi:putative nucleotidyltransferase with HDIG domain